MTWYSLHWSNSLQPLEEAGYSFPSKQALPFPFPAMALVLAWLQGNLFSLAYLTESNLASFLPVYQVSLQHSWTTIRANSWEGVGLCNRERGIWEVGLPLLTTKVTRLSQAYCWTSPSLFTNTQNYSDLMDKLPIAYQGTALPASEKNPRI